MTHEELQELLEGYVDETLDRPTRAAVDDHLAGCVECRTILDDVAAIPLGPGADGRLDQRTLRRSVRRATLRTILDAALMLVGVWLALWLAAVLVIQPLVINRGGRAATMTEATLDLATMLNPGVWVEDFEIQSSALGRTATATVVLPIGGGNKELGEIASMIGPIGFGDATGGSFFPYARTDLGFGDARDVIPNLGEGTVSTVALGLATSMSVEEAQAVADSPDHDVAVVWAGFGIGDPQPGSPIGFEDGGTLGYSTCLVPDGSDDTLFGATSASMSRGLGFAPSSISGALDRVRSALVNLGEQPAIGEALVPTVSRDQLATAISLLAEGEPAVTMLVVTGPTQEVEGLLGDLPDAGASLLAVDFYNWSNPVCGR